jgi:hypothetical protein
MGISRLLAKAWMVFCLFAGLYALTRGATGAGGLSTDALIRIFAIVVLFLATGLLFVAGYAAATNRAGDMVAKLRPPGFHDLVFLVFALTSFLVQSLYLPVPPGSDPLGALAAAIDFAVPGQGALTMALGSCGLGGDALTASDFAWLLAFIYVGSSLSRLRLAAGIIRLERKQRPDPLTPTGSALLTGLVAVALIQLLYVGSLYSLLPCTLWQGIGGEALIGQAPLALAYAVVAALTNLIAMGADA